MLYVSAVVCSSVDGITQKLWMNFDEFLEGWHVRLAATDYIIVMIRITMWIQEFLEGILLRRVDNACLRVLLLLFRTVSQKTWSPVIFWHNFIKAAIISKIILVTSM